MKQIITLMKNGLSSSSIFLMLVLTFNLKPLNAQEQPPKPSIEFTVVYENTDMNFAIEGEGQMFIDRGNGYKYKIPLQNGSQNMSKKGETLKIYGKVKEISFMNADVSSINVENCPTLEKLEIMNLPYAKISKLDFSKNLKLKKIKCPSLDVMEVMLPNEECELQDIDLSVNKISKLDVSNCPKLVKLNVILNKIEYKQMQKLVKGLNDTKVGKYEEKQFFVFSTSSKEANVCSKSQVKIATDKGWSVSKIKLGQPSDYEGSEDPKPVVDNRVVTTLSTMKVSGDKLMIKVQGNEDLSIDLGNGEKVDLSKEDKIQELTLQSSEVKLYGDITKLYCPKNKITALDLSNLPALIDLNCSDNELTTLDLSANANLEMLDICNNKIAESEMGKLIETLNSKKADKVLIVVSDKEVGNECKKEQVQMLKSKNWSVKQIKISDNSNELSDYEGKADKSSVLSIDNKEVRVYPNPTTDYIYLETQNTNSTYKVYNVCGYVVKKGLVSSGVTVKIDVRDLSNGIYIVEVSGNKTKLIKK